MDIYRKIKIRDTDRYRFIYNSCFNDLSADFAHFAAATTAYECRQSSSEVVHNLEIAAEKIFDHFSFNCQKANSPQHYLFLSL